MQSPNPINVPFPVGRFFPAIALLLCGGLLPAQAWRPVLTDERCHFKAAGNTLIQHTIQVNHASVIPGAALRYSLNRIVTACDTCAIPAKLRDQGQFLQEHVAIRPDGSAWFTGKHPFVLYPQAPAGFEWLMDTLAQVRARITSVHTGPVLGEPDSLKVIDLSDGGNLVLSRNHGIVQFPARAGNAALELAGMETRQLGDRLPDWLDFHDFAVGDVFQRRYATTIFPGEWGYRLSVEKIRILERYFDQDTLKYRVARQQRSWLEWSGPPRIAYRRDTIVLAYHIATAPAWIVGGYPGQWVQPAEDLSEDLSSSIRYTPDPVYSAIWGLGSGAVSFPLCDVYFTENAATVLPCEPCYTYGHLYAPGLGRTYFERSCFEAFERETLEGFIKNGDTTGVISSDSLLGLSATRDPDFTTGIQVLPNPGRGIFTLQWANPASELLLLRVYDAQGRLMTQQTVSAGTTVAAIDATNWPAGVYGVVLRSKRGQGTLRLVRE